MAVGSVASQFTGLGLARAPAGSESCGLCGGGKAQNGCYFKGRSSFWGAHVSDLYRNSFIDSNCGAKFEKQKVLKVCRAAVASPPFLDFPKELKEEKVLRGLPAVFSS
ncbi:hypothetical protein O6H91_Y543500 [Diphasiastrum complanatum]|nr:hypothetical protein O6H91_Y543500 [Diphasiastrum complanatum]